MDKKNEYIKLLDFCKTDRQRQVVNALHEEGSQRLAGISLGISKSTVSTVVERLQTVAARRGWSPDHDMTKTVPEGFHLKGTSTLYDKEGKQVLQWSKTNIDHKRQQELMEEAIKALAEEIPKAKKRKHLKHHKKTL